MKRTLALVLTLALCLGLFGLPVMGVGAVEKDTATAIDEAQPYFLADTGTPVSLASLSVTLGETTASGADLEWTASDDAVTVGEDSLTVTAKGPHALTVSNGTDTLTVYAVAKDPGDTEYVLLEEDFDDVAEGALPEGWTLAAGTAQNGYVDADGRLVLDSMSRGNGSGTRVLMPAWLAAFGDYQIEADMQIAEYKNAQRWSAIMYRIQMESAKKIPYYLMTFRVNASSNGVEFGMRTPGDSWNVMEKASFTENLSSSKSYQISVRTEGKRVIEKINDTTVIDTELASEYLTGGIGFQSDQNKTFVDNVRVTIPVEDMPYRPAFAEIYRPDTTLSLSPSVIAPVTTAAELAAYAVDGARPTYVMASVTGGEELKAGTDLTVEQVLQGAAGKVVPILRVEDQASADALAQYLSENEYVDVVVLSSDPALVGSVRKTCPLLFGAVDYTGKGELTEEMLGDLVSEANTNWAKYLLLSADQATAEAVRFLQARFMTVWTMGEETMTVEQVGHLLKTCVNGVVTPDYETCFEVYETFDDAGYFTQEPFIVGHRGVPSLAPENTLEGAKLAYELGADAIETDIYLTTDDHLVIIHDDTLNRTTNGTGKVEDYSLAELKELVANKDATEAIQEQYPDVRIPTLEEFFQYFGDKDVLQVIELKSSNPDLVEALAELIEEYDMYDKVVCISFDTAQLERMRTYLPGISTAYLVNNGPKGVVDIPSTMRSITGMTQPLNAIYSPSYSGLSLDYVRASIQRGMPFAAWTVNTQIGAQGLIGAGIDHITTNNAQVFSDFLATVVADQEAYALETGDTLDFTASGITYAGESRDVTVTPLILSGDECVSVEGTTLTATAPGTVQLVLYTSYSDTVTRYVYSDVVTVTITGDPVVWQQGDVNGDGSVNSSDARMVLQYTVELIPLTEEQLARANMNGDGLVNSSDARMILQAAVGL